VAIARFGVRPMVAGGTLVALASAWPLSGYATQVYPEIPAALALVALVALGTGRCTPARTVAVILLATALPWLAVKFVPVTATIVVVLLARWWRGGNRSAVWTSLAVLAVSGLAYLGLHHAWYGGWTSYAAAEHFADRGEFAVIGFDPQILGRSRRLIGLIVGRDFGLAAWQPLWLLLPAAAGVMLRRRPPGWQQLFWPLAVGWLNVTFVALTMQGWWVPGRQLVVVLPLGAVTIAWWIDRAQRPWQVSAGVLGAAGVVTYVWLVVDGLAGRLTWIVDFARVGDPLLAARRLLLPDYLTVTTTTWVLHSAWIIVVAALVALALGTERRAGAPSSGSGP